MRENFDSMLDGRIVYVDGFDIHTRDHAVTYTQVGKVESILEHLDLVLFLLLRFHRFGIHQVDQIVTVERGRDIGLDGLVAEETQYAV